MYRLGKLSSQGAWARRGFASSAIRQRIQKIVPSVSEALRDVKSGSLMLVGGFGLSGVPATLINGLAAHSELRDLTVVSNNAGMPGVGLGIDEALLLFALC